MPIYIIESANVEIYTTNAKGSDFNVKSDNSLSISNYKNLYWYSYKIFSIYNDPTFTVPADSYEIKGTYDDKYNFNIDNDFKNKYPYILSFSISENVNSVNILFTQYYLSERYWKKGQDQKYSGKWYTDDISKI